MAKVEAPNTAYNGSGPGGVTFVDGVAECDDDAALNYYRQAGYKVSGKVDNPIEIPEPPDPRDGLTEVVGTPLRDAAVDPREGDFLPPTNAGNANPHGPQVVSPEIHASGPAGIRPGQVFVEDVDKQAERETAFAQARLVDGVSFDEAGDVEVPDRDDRGALGISDPGSASAGREAAEGVADESDATSGGDEKPAKVAAKRPARKAAAKKVAAKRPARKAAAKKVAAS